MKLFAFLLLLTTALLNAQTPTPTPCQAVGVNSQFSDSNFDLTNFQGCAVNNPDGSTTATVGFGSAHTLGPQKGRLDWVVPARVASVTVNGVPLSTSSWTNWSNGSPPLYVILLSFTVTTSPQTIVASPSPPPTPTPTPTPTPSPPILSSTASVTLAWDNSDASVTGFNVYYGTASGKENTQVPVGNFTGMKIALPTGATYFFVVKALNAAGVESMASNEISQTL